MRKSRPSTMRAPSPGHRLLGLYYVALGSAAALLYRPSAMTGRRERRPLRAALKALTLVHYRDWRSVASLAVDAVSSVHSKRIYEKALKDFLAWYSGEARPPFSRAVVQHYRSVLESASLAPPSINLRLSASRKLAAEAAENDLLDRSVAQGIVSLKGVHQSGARAGNWLTREQARDLLAQPEPEAIEGKRDRAIRAVLLGCALRRSELAVLDCGHIQ